MPNAIQWAESGTNATYDTSPYTGGLVGSPTSSTNTPHTGLRVLECNSGAGNAATAAWSPSSILSDAGRCISVYFYVATFNTADAIILIGSLSTIAAVFNMRIIAASKILSLFDAGSVGTLHKNGSTVIALNTWYRLSVSYNIVTTSNWSINVYLNGSLEIRATNADFTLTRTGTNLINLGWFTAPGANSIIRYSDIYVDNRTDLTDCGDIRITAKRPFANGTLNQLTTEVGVGDSGFGSGHSPQVNERIRSDTNGWSFALDSTGGTLTEAYSIETADSGDVDITNNVVVGGLGWIQADATVGTNNTCHLICGANTAFTITTASAHYFVPSAIASYPSGPDDIAFTVATSSTVRTFNLFEAGMLIAFFPNLPPNLGPAMGDLLHPQSVDVTMLRY